MSGLVDVTTVKRNVADATVGPVVDTYFRAWVQELHDQLIAVGMVRDTVSIAAQMSLSTGTLGLNSDVSQFIIYELNDSLSAILPIYIKITFTGRATNTSQTTLSSIPDTLIETGTTVSASGVLGGMNIPVWRHSNPTSTAGSYSPNFNASRSVISKGDGFLFVALDGAGTTVGASPSPCILSFYLERIPDRSGNFTANGYTLLRGHNNAASTVTSPPVAPTARTVSAIGANGGTGNWYGQPCVCMGGAQTASVDGAIQLQRFYHVTPEILPMRGLVAYYNGLINPKDAIVASLDGVPRRFYALGGSASTTVHCFYGYLPDFSVPAYSLAVLME